MDTISNRQDSLWIFEALGALVFAYLEPPCKDPRERCRAFLPRPVNCAKAVEQALDL